MPRTFFKILAAFLLLLLGAFILTEAMTSGDLATRDYLTYWAAGHQLAMHQNPYDGPQILALEKSVGFVHDHPFFMRNPPTAFLIAYPLGFVSLRTGGILWSLALIVALIVSIRMLWRMLGSPTDRLHLLGYIFPPVLACLLHGQIGIFLLFFLTCFFYFQESVPVLAGAALFAFALKPHLFIPFGLVLLAWTILNKRYRLLGGAALAVGIDVGFAFVVDKAGWHQFATMLRGAEIYDESIPTISLALRLLVHRQWHWLQFAPCAIAAAFCLRYYVKHRSHWNWTNQGVLLLAISVMVAPYAWFTDESLAVPAILFGLYRATRAQLLVFTVLVIPAMAVLLFAVPMNTGFYIWTAPAWVLWCLNVQRSRNAPAPPELQPQET